jgi:hypothetical protein
MSKYSFRANGWLNTLTFWLVVGMLTIHLIAGLFNLTARASPLFVSSALTFPELLQSDSRVAFDQVEFIRKQTPEQAVLLLGPKWYPQHALYFLYPRRLFFGGAGILAQHPEIEYVIIDDPGYPNFAVDGDKVMLDAERGLYKIRR